MPKRKMAVSLGFALILLGVAGCSHGNSGDDDSRPRTNVDLTVTDFSATPPSADPEDPLTLTGTIQNIGSETANPNAGDSFRVRFNISLDGTFEVEELGFLEKTITDPIPPGGSLSFTYTSPYGDGDTQSIYGLFCTSQSCSPPETGVIGVKVDAADGIYEVDEGNNFQFVTHEVVGTLVAINYGGCNFGGQDESDPGCNLTISDGLFLQTFHAPCSNCSGNSGIVLPNELHRFVNVSLVIKGCQSSSAPNGTCGGSWTITAVTQKPGLPASTKQALISCITTFPATTRGCPLLMEIRDPNY